MKVFLDIGAHTGETLTIVLDPKWGFDRIYCFEPAATCWPEIRKIADDRVQVCEFGLWHHDENLILNNPGAVGASMSSDKDESLSTDVCEFKDAGEWFDHNLGAGDEVYVKINAEGAEVDIIDRLYATDQLAKISHLLVHLDVRKIPSLREREAALLEQLQSSGVEFHAAEEIQFGGVYRGTGNWLAWCHASARTRNFRYKTVSRSIFLLRRQLYPLKVWLKSRRSVSSTA